MDLTYPFIRPLRAQFHANGFYKIELAYTSDRDKFVLHYWPTLPSGSDIHSHRWDFVSHILCGSLEEVIYRSGHRSDDDRFCRLVYRDPTGSPSKYELSQSDFVRLTPICSTVHSIGSTYFRRSDQIHSTTPIKMPCLTYVHQAAPTNVARVYRKSPPRRGDISTRWLGKSDILRVWSNIRLLVSEFPPGQQGVPKDAIFETE